jgi:glycerophosphoryl diester phosphodiesterase
MRVVIIIILILLILFVLYLISIKTNPRRKGFPFQKCMIAHRGLYGAGIPENSLTAFKMATEKGVGVELDVQLTKDKKLVVFHDDNLRRVCDADVRVKDLTYNELSRYTLNGTNERIPLFSEVLDVLGDVPLICEIKTSSDTDYKEICASAYKLLKTYNGKFCVESFHPGAVRWFRKNHPEVIRGQLSMNFKSGKGMNPFMCFLLKNMMFNIFSSPDFIAYNYKDTNVPGFRFCKMIYRPFLVAWTARGTSAVKDAASLGFDTIIFELGK